MNDMVMLSLTEAPVRPVEGMLPSPYQWTEGEFSEAKFLLKLPLCTLLDSLSRIKSPAGWNPERIAPLRRSNLHEQDLVLRGQEDSSNRLPLNYS